MGVGDSIRFVVDPWETDDSWGAGYLAGFFDGEGTVRNYPYGTNWGISFVQRPGEVLDQTLQILKDKGFNPVYRPTAREKLAGQWDEKNHRTHSDAQVWILNGLAETLRFVGSMGGAKMARQAAGMWEG